MWHDGTSLVEKNDLQEVFEKLLLGQLGNFDPIWVIIESLYLTISSQDFVKLCSMLINNRYTKIVSAKFPPNFVFQENGQIWTNLTQIYKNVYPNLNLIVCIIMGYHGLAKVTLEQMGKFGQVFGS